jgi:hypothetical protein
MSSGSGLLSSSDDDYLGGEKQFGERYNGRYHLPLLPGEHGTKAGGNYVPCGVMSATNLAGSFVDSRELALWMERCVLLGLASREELYEALKVDVDAATYANVPLRDLNSTPEGKALRDRLNEVATMARAAGGGSVGADKGTNRHTAWEYRGTSGLLAGTRAMRDSIEATERLLNENGLERVPGLSERVVRNVGLEACGRFDDILLSRKTGRLYLADLKTKPKPFFSWVETWIQQAVYATSEWMLNDGRDGYVPGPLHHVDQDSSVLLRMPSDGRVPFLQRVDLRIGHRWATLARDVVRARSEGKSRKLDGLTAWSE